MTLTTSFAALIEFLSQPWGVCGAICIMLAVTCFNSRALQRRLAVLGLGELGTPILLNALNLVGGACLLVNAVMRHEVVWEVLEVYFVLISCKGLLQAWRGHAFTAGPRQRAVID
jgi:hypothetical protein